MLRDRFDAARDAAGIPKAQFQPRGLRATAATTLDDDGGIRLEHTTERMTAQYIRHKVGKKVKPVRRIAEHAQSCGTRPGNFGPILLLLR
ncbi:MULTISPECIES: hypothetical protein [Delftia]|jgi:hypothetical protein|uniref:Uncharacterized protein n=1 Tax=Delftia tsuruhatensis TaxID=180282 RepID=A0AAX3SFB0_9BURK|nr:MULTISPECIES: hypothetical protein [Delftia]MDH0419863.1 hypothetical protein [Delftia tsuruhatensis]MDH2229578.1 hypothetical protein [Delftia tsuruhatensis]WFF78725.1 hypothetical protein PYR84_17455 [Delftia tsuruhatensis]WON87362.1 hypothetical protein OK021_21790 [Delftia sp. UGAL515B_04]